MAFPFLTNAVFNLVLLHISQAFLTSAFSENKPKIFFWPFLSSDLWEKKKKKEEGSDFLS